MLRIRKVAVAVLALALVAFLGTSTAAPLLGTKAAGDDADKWLLDNAEVVLTVNIKALLDAESVKKNVPALKDMLKDNEQLKSVLDATGIDLFKDVHTLLASGTGSSAKDAKFQMVIKGNFNAAKLSAAARKKADDVKVHKDGATEVYEIKLQDQPAFAALAGPSTLVLTQSKDATVEALKNGGKRVGKVSKEMKAALGNFTGKETMTFAMVANDEVKKMIGAVPQLAASANKLDTLTASITVSDAVALNVTGNTSDAKAANQLKKVLEVVKGTAEVAVQGMEDLPPVVSEVLGAIQIALAKESVQVNLKVTKEMLEKAAKLGGGK